MKKTAILALCVLTAASAGAQSLAEKTGADAMVGVPPSTEDFVKEVARSDMFEIRSSKLALKQGDDQTKAFAQQMITDHKKTTAELKGLIKSGKVSAQAPGDLGEPLKTRLGKLKKETGQDFTSNYDEDQVSAHKDAVSLFERYAKDGDNPALKDWASRTLPTLQKHLEMAQALGK